MTIVCKKSGSILDNVRSYLVFLWYRNVPNGGFSEKGLDKKCSFKYTVCLTQGTQADYTVKLLNLVTNSNDESYVDTQAM